MSEEYQVEDVNNTDIRVFGGGETPAIYVGFKAEMIGDLVDQMQQFINGFDDAQMGLGMDLKKLYKNGLEGPQDPSELKMDYHSKNYRRGYNHHLHTVDQL